MQKEIKVFIISPEDVRVERDIVKEVCEEIAIDLKPKNIDLVTIDWHDYPLSAMKNPQESIDPFLEKADIFVAILWYRLGTAIEGMVGAVTGEKNVTGTQYEIEKIIAMKKERFYIYFKQEEPSFNLDKIDEASKQKYKLDSFRERIGFVKGDTKRGYHEFISSEDFRESITKHLYKEIEEIFGIKISSKRKPLMHLRITLLGVLLFTLLASIWWMISKKETIVDYKHIQTHIKKEPTVKPQNSLSQKIGYILVTVLNVKKIKNEVHIALKFVSTRKKIGASVAIYAEGSDNIADFWKFFPRPKMIELSDENGYAYRFKNTTMKYAKTGKDWTTIYPGSEQIVQFIFTHSSEVSVGKRLTFSVLIRTAMADHNGKPALSSATLYLDGLVPN